MDKELSQHAFLEKLAQQEELLQDIVTIEDMIQQLEYLRTLHIKMLNKRQEDYLEQLLVDWNSEERMVHFERDQEGVMILKMDFSLPYFRREEKHNRQYHLEIMSVYTEMIREAISRSTYRPDLEKKEHMYVLFDYHFSEKTIRDLDNRYYSVVLNALRGAMIINDDSWRTLTYCQTGRFSEAGPKTYVYIAPLSRMQTVNKIAGLI